MQAQTAEQAQTTALAQRIALVQNDALAHSGVPPFAAPDDALIRRLLPSANPDAHDRAQAWTEWHIGPGPAVVLKFIRANNTSPEADDDLLQETLVTTYLEVEREHYAPRPGVPFTAYIKGIARNKIREARRRQRRWEPLDENAPPPAYLPRPLEASYDSDEERRALRQGLQLLPASRRQVLEHYLGGHSLSEIAVTLRMNEALVRQHKHRGLKVLQQALLG